MTDQQDTHTIRIYREIEKAFDMLNDALFEGELPRPVFTLQRHRGALGYFCRNRFTDNMKRDGSMLDEIAINPQYNNIIEPKEILSTLGHEMVHLWQHHFGKPTKTNPHNAEWGRKMTEVGLPPCPVKPGGKITGRKVSNTIEPGGIFDVASQSIMTQVDLAVVGDALKAEGPSKPPSGRYSKYNCPCCGFTARAKKEAIMFCHNHEGEPAQMVEEVK